MKYIVKLSLALVIAMAPVAVATVAAAGIGSSNGGSRVVGEKFTITVSASGATFDSLQGTISVSGPVEIVSFSPGSATWLPGKSPADGQQFVGIIAPTTSAVVARITLRGTKEGSGSVNVSGVKLASKGDIVGTDANGSGFKIGRAPVLPGGVNVSSVTHPKQDEAYENRSINLSWEKAAGVSEFSYILDQAADTTPATSKSDGAGTTVTFDGKDIGTYYFHIRAKNGDGWGGTTHFKITIKEPDPKIESTLAKPVVKDIRKMKTFSTDLVEGTATGIELSGTGQPGYSMNVKFSPTLGETGELVTVTADESGAWVLSLEKPVKAGFYSVTVQGQQEKVLTPMSKLKYFEISLAKAGNVEFIDEGDAVPTPGPSPTSSASKGSATALRPLLLALAVAIVGTGAVAGIVQTRRRRKARMT